MALFWGSFLVASIGIIETSGGYISIFWGGSSVENLPELSNFHTFCTFVPHSFCTFQLSVLFLSHHLTHIPTFQLPPKVSKYKFQLHTQISLWNSAFATKQPSKIIPIQHYLVSKYHLKPPFCLMGH